MSPKDIEGHSSWCLLLLLRRDAAGETQPCLPCAELNSVKRINPSVEGGGSSHQPMYVLAQSVTCFDFSQGTIKCSNLKKTL